MLEDVNMAYENGDNVYDYCQLVFEKYKKDYIKRKYRM